MSTYIDQIYMINLVSKQQAIKRINDNNVT
jgi:hypothetical protein